MSIRPLRIDASTRRLATHFFVGGGVTGAALAMLLAYASVLGFWNGRTPPTRGDYVEQVAFFGALGGAAGLVLGGLVALVFQLACALVAAWFHEDAHGAPPT